MTSAYKLSKYTSSALLSLLLLLLMMSCNSSGSQKSVSETDTAQTSGAETLVSQVEKLLPEHELLAWCIVPFDSVERGPAERIAMLQELGFEQYVYDWREQHLASFPEEIQKAKEAGIHISGVWMWIDGNADAMGALSAANEQLLSMLKANNLQTQIWLGINHNFFEAEDEAGKVEKGATMVRYLNQRAKEIGCTLALYNHGDWFGEPDNQLKILKEWGSDEVGIIYNFHHAHHQIKEFPQLLERMLPHLWAVNLNGMQQDGPKILPIGSGNAEAEMIQTLLESDYDGPIGILGHVEDADVKVVLQRNLEGLASLLRQQQSMN